MINISKFLSQKIMNKTKQNETIKNSTEELRKKYENDPEKSKVIEKIEILDPPKLKEFFTENFDLLQRNLRTNSKLLAKLEKNSSFLSPKRIEKTRISEVYELLKPLFVLVENCVGPLKYYTRFSRDFKSEEEFNIGNPDNLLSSERISLIKDYFYLIFNNSKNIYKCFWTLSKYSYSEFSFKNKIMEYAAKLQLNLSSEEEKDIKVIMEKIMSLNTINISLNFEEIRELHQYYSIIKNELYFNFFIEEINYSATNILVQDYEEEMCFKINTYNLNIQPLNKIDIFRKEYFKIAFTHIVNHCKKNGILFTEYNLKDFFINGLKGLALFQYDNLKIWGEKITHILRCDKCHKQVEPYLDDYFNSSASIEEAKFKCPFCGEVYTYSHLKRIYDHNVFKSYENK